MGGYYFSELIKTLTGLHYFYLFGQSSIDLTDFIGTALLHYLKDVFFFFFFFFVVFFFSLGVLF